MKHRLIDGRMHYVDIGRAEAIEPMVEGIIIAIGPKRAEGFDTLTSFTCFHCLPRASRAMRFQGLRAVPKSY